MLLGEAVYIHPEAHEGEMPLLLPMLYSIPGLMNLMQLVACMHVLEKPRQLLRAQSSWFVWYRPDTEGKPVSESHCCRFCRAA